jgi:hypothetical protein
MLYHHSRDLESVVFGEVKGNPEFSDPDFRKAYLWLEKEVGFYPLFLAVGATEEDIKMTCYGDNWIAKTSRKKGEFPNNVLFSFNDVKGVFTDYQYWHFILNANNKNYSMTYHEKKLIFKPSWKESDWLRKARKEPHSVQLVAPKLYLPDASRIWVRNNATRSLLNKLGFQNIEVRRIS